MTVYLCIPHAPVALPGGPVVNRKGVNRFRLRWTNHHPLSHYGLGVLLDVRGEAFDAQQFRLLRDRVGAWIEAQEEAKVRGAMGLAPDERIGRAP